MVELWAVDSMGRGREVTMNFGWAGFEEDLGRLAAHLREMVLRQPRD